MKYGIFTVSELTFHKHCSNIFGARYKGYKTLPMLVWKRHRVVLQDGTDVSWIDTTKDLYYQLCGRRFDCIHVVDGVSQLQLLEEVIPRFWPYGNYS